ncbi:MAG: hypothetical protein FJZ86_04480 [Chloroflexi bacterium]|nr:hypothetical protein [Chloroflexota bacterium]
MNPKLIRSFVLILALLICLLAIAAGIWMYSTGMGMPFDVASPPPVIRIAQPADGSLVASGQGIALAAEAIADGGLSRVDFLVDGQVAQQYVPTSAEIKFDTPVFIWFGVRPGWHTLSVVAYDMAGRASPEVSVRVGVTADLGSGIPGGEAMPNGEDQPQVPEGGDDGAGNPPGDVNPPVAPQDPNQPNQDQPNQNQPGDQAPPAGENLPELPPPPQDNPPEIVSFRMASSVNADGVVSLSGFAEGTDDLGLQRLVLNWQGADVGEVSVICGGAMACQIQHDAALTPGEWIFSAQAFDLSGQASLPSVRVVQVLEHDALPPAVADDALDGWALSDWFADHWDDINVNVELEPGFDLGDLWRQLPGNGVDAQASGQCLTYFVEPFVDGIRHTLTVDCDLRTEGADEFLMPLVSKELPNTNIPSIQLRVPEWVDRARVRIAAGETFTWLDDDVTCDTPYHYRVSVVRMVESANGYSSRATLGSAETDVSTPPCFPGAMGDVNLRSERAGNGARISWNLNGGNIWPPDLPPEGVTFTLARFDLDTQQSEILYRENLSAQVLQAGGEYSAADNNLKCGNRYEYMLTGIAADADFGLVSPGWLLRAHTPAPELPCPPGGLGEISLRTQHFWIHDGLLAARIFMQIPAGFNWPQGERVELRILSQRQGDNDCDGPPCNPFWELVEIIPINAQIQAQGLNYEGVDHDADTGGATYIYRLALFVNNVEAQSGRNFTLTMPKAPPPPPDILRVTATNNCPGGAPRCVIVEWAPYEGPDADNEFYAQAARIYVERVVGALDTERFLVELGDTRFVDTSPYMAEHRLADGSIRRVCSYSVTYRMIAFDADGHSFGASPITIQTPECNAPWNVVGEAN